MTKLFVTVLICVITLPAWVGAQDSPVAAVSLQNEIVLGLVPEQNIFRQVERYTPVARYLSEAIGKNVRLRAFTRYTDVIDALGSAGIDGAFLGSFAAAVAIREKGAMVLARPEDMDGSSTYHGLLFVRKDSGIRDIRDMKGKRFAFVGSRTTAGFLLPLYYFRTHGVTDYKRYFKDTYFAGTHENAIRDVLDGKADIGAAKNTIFRRLAAKDARVDAELKILSRSPDVPEVTLTVRKDLDPSTSATLRTALLKMHDDPAGRVALKDFGARRFIPVSKKDYEPVVDYAHKAGVDFTRYDTANEP